MSTDFVVDLLEDPDSKKQEALSWLKAGAGRNTLGELLGPDGSVELVREAYETGAEEVLAIEIDEYDEEDGVHGNTGKLIIRLPPEGAARKRIFEWCTKQSEAQGFDGPADEGQTHLLVRLD
jgi:hypothetical protein